MKLNNNNIKRYTFENSNTKIEYIIERKKVKNINIRIRNKIIYVSANNMVSKEYIENILISKWNWIINAIKIEPNIYLKENKYIQGEKILYLGKYYKVNILNHDENKIELGENFNIYIYDIHNEKNLNKLVNNWYLKNLDIVFKDSLSRNLELIKNYTNIIPKLKYRKMKSRWGSCTMPMGIITLNKNLIKAPIECIDYVVIHELVHLVHQNHSRNFYNLLEELMPNWKEYRDILNNR